MATEIPAEINEAMGAISDLMMAGLWAAYAVGNYTANPSPTKRHHDGVRDAGANAVAAARMTVTKLEGVVRLGRDAERRQDASKLHVVGES